MEVYILDDLLRRTTIIDRYESCIWTERYSAYGDFQLVIHSTPQFRSILVEGTQLTVNNSKKVMTIENVENRDDAEGRSMLTVTGRSLEAVLEDRAVRRDLDGTDVDPTFVLTEAPPAAALRSLFNYICVAGTLDAGDIIPMITSGSLYPTNTIAEPEDSVILAFEPTDLYTALKQACDVYGLGFRLYRGPDTSLLYFNIYTGDDRTAIQTTLPAVIFSPDLENLSNTAEFRSIEKYKNVALVVSPRGSRWVYANTSAATAVGFDRRVVVINATDLELPPYALTQPQIDSINGAITAHAPLTDKDLLENLIKNAFGMSSTQMAALNTLATGGGSPLTAPEKANLVTVLAYYNNWLNVDVQALLEKRGKDELTKHKALKAIDGELAVNSKYRYGTDYELGDLVEMRNDDGLTNRMRVTEHIRVDDVQGERAYPTLTIDEFITPGDWSAWDANGVWDDAPGVWDDLPAG